MAASCCHSMSYVTIILDCASEGTVPSDDGLGPTPKWIRIHLPEQVR